MNSRWKRGIGSILVNPWLPVRYFRLPWSPWYSIAINSGAGDFHSNPYRQRNEWLSAKTRHCLSALGIVAKEQQPAGCYKLTKRPDFRITYCYHIAYLFFCYELLCTSLRGFRRQLFMQCLNRKNSPIPQNKLLIKPQGANYDWRK